jgi:hypothetical protein
VTHEENDPLQAPFLKEEVKDAVFSCYPKGAPGPDGLPFLFFQKFRGFVKGDLMQLVTSFQDGSLDIFRINFATITPIPKVEDAADMKNFRPISLFSSFKIFSKLLTLRLESLPEDYS